MVKVSSLRRILRLGGGFTACLIAVTLLFVNARLADAQALYGSIVGNVTDAQGALAPGVTLTATNTGTGLEVETVTDADGAYTFRNLLPGSYDVKAVLSGFREHKQTGITVTAGNPVRINITLAVGALTETVQVAADTTLLQTDKADLSTQLNSKEITDLPLNQYRNYQALLNLVPGATPAQFQNAEIDTPGRSLRTWVNGTQPNSNATRIDGAVSVNIWLPHHVGYVQPAETIETVNVSTNSFDAEYGMAGGAATTVITKSGTNDVHGSGVLVRQHRRVERQHLLQQRVRPAEGSAQPQHLRRHRRRAGDPQQAVLLRVVRALRRSARVARQLRRADGEDAHRRLQRSGGRLRQLPPLQPVHRRRRRRRPRAVPEQQHPVVDDQRGGALGHGLLPAAQHDRGSELEPDPRRLPAVPRGPRRSQQLRPQDDLAAQRLALGVGQVRDAGRRSDRQLLARLRRRQPRRHPRLRRRLRPHLDAEPDPRARRQLRRQHPEPAGHRARLRRRPRPRASASPARTATTSAQSGLPHFAIGPTTTPATTSAPRRTGCRCSARSAATRSAPR